MKFSLAGVQLKFSMVDAGKRLTLPGRNESGRVIVKLPTKDYPRLPELEYAAMQLAAAAGVAVAPCELAPMLRIYGIPTRLLARGDHVLVIPRFDRRPGRRIHFEDFAQVLGAVGDREYSMCNEETNFKLLSRFVAGGAGAILEAVRRTTRKRRWEPISLPGCEGPCYYTTAGIDARLDGHRKEVAACLVAKLEEPGGATRGRCRSRDLAEAAAIESYLGSGDDRAIDPPLDA